MRNFTISNLLVLISPFKLSFAFRNLSADFAFQAKVRILYVI